jgi:hypothetical protein
VFYTDADPFDSGVELQVEVVGMLLMSEILQALAVAEYCVTFVPYYIGGFLLRSMSQASGTAKFY